MAHSLPRPGGLGQIYRWGQGASVVKKQLTRRGEIRSIESLGALGLNCAFQILNIFVLAIGWLFLSWLSRCQRRLVLYYICELLMGDFLIQKL
jgi:hypothetical protein